MHSMHSTVETEQHFGVFFKQVMHSKLYMEFNNTPKSILAHMCTVSLQVNAMESNK